MTFRPTPEFIFSFYQSNARNGLKDTFILARGMYTHSHWGEVHITKQNKVSPANQRSLSLQRLRHSLKFTCAVTALLMGWILQFNDLKQIIFWGGGGDLGQGTSCLTDIQVRHSENKYSPTVKHVIYNLITNSS